MRTVNIMLMQDYKPPGTVPLLAAFHIPGAGIAEMRGALFFSEEEMSMRVSPRFP
jgi:hypothetical protein